MTDAIEPRDGVVAFAGDWHGETSWATVVIEQVAERTDVLLHVGDFGIWPGDTGAKYLRKVNRACEQHGVRILITPGNHEDWSRLFRRWVNPKLHAEDGSLLPIPLTDHISVLPRGYRWQMKASNGRANSFVGLGGAPSVDAEHRTKGRSWWPEEMMTEADVDAVASGGYADVMVTHDAPGPPYACRKVVEILDTNPLGFSEAALAYATVGRERVTRAFEAVAPRLSVHGHYHVSDETAVRVAGAEYDTTVWSLAANRMAGNWRVLDLATLLK